MGFIGLALLLSLPLHAQKEGANWYFGNLAGLDFNNQYPKPLIDGRTASSEGVSAISDKDGKIQFYTDGKNIYSNNPLTPTELAGNNASTQSSVIVPWPNHPGQFYVFTLGPVGRSASPGTGVVNQGKSLRYSIVNMNTNEVKPLNEPLLDGYTEKITAIRHSNGKDWWILVHQINNSVFQEYLISEGPNPIGPTDQVIGLWHLVDETYPLGASGYLKASPNGDMVALAVEGFKRFEVFKFNNSTGKLLSIPAPIALSSEGAYGVEFSPTGKYLYGTNRKSGMIYRWNLQNFNEADVSKSREILLQGANLKCGALQLATNGKIYIAFDQQPYLGVINDPDHDTCKLDLRGASLFDHTTSFQGISGFGLPNIPSVYYRNEIYYANNCANDTTTIYLSSKDLVDAPPLWIIDGMELSGDENSYEIKYAFKTPRDYPVEMVGTKNGTKFSLKRTIRIHPVPVTGIMDTTYICEGQTHVLHDRNYAFYGITDSSGVYFDKVSSLTNPGLYKVSVTNYEGCSEEVTTRAISTNKPAIDSIRVTPASCTDADNGSIQIFVGGNSADYSFIWAGGFSGTTFRDGLKPGEYQVTISIKGGCAMDTTLTVETSKLNVRIARLPADPAPVCPGDPVTLTVTGDADSYVWDYNNATQTSVDVYPDTTTTYRVTGTTGGLCFGYDSIRIVVKPNNKLNLGIDRTPCNGETVTLSGKESELGSVYRSWLWSTGETTDFKNITQDITGLWLLVADNNGCSYRDTINVTFKPAVTVNITSIPNSSAPVCPGTSITLMASGASSYEWVNLSGVVANAIRVQPDTTTTYTVIGSDGGQCSGTASITVEVFPNNKPDLGADLTQCWNDTVVLRRSDIDPGSIYKTWTWSVPEAGDSVLIFPPVTTVLLIVTDVNQCVYRDSMDFTFNPLPVVNSVTKKDITCSGAADGSLEIKVDGDPTQLQYSIYTTESWSGNRVYNNLTANNYLIQAKNNLGCISLAWPVTILESEPLQYTLKNIAPSCADCTDGEIQVNVTGGTKPYSFVWNPSNHRDSVYSHIGADDYTISITDANGCSLQIDVSLVALELLIPNAFSPNGGNRNEKWMIRILDNRPDCLVEVYDRSGQVVFYDDQFYEPWDGTYMNEGRKLPAGTYYYLIRIDRNDTNKPPQRGTITILR